MGVRVRVEFRVGDLKGKGVILRRGRWLPSRSLIKQFVQLLKVTMSGVAETMKRVDGTSASQAVASGFFNLYAAAGVTGFGVVVGSGDSAVTMVDYKLETQVTANLTHSAVGFIIESPSASVWRVLVYRTFTNTGGSDILIKEVGLYTNVGATATYHCVDRSLFAFAIRAGGAKTIWYRFSFSL